MGPIRRRLTAAAAALLASANMAFAQACETLRPNWDGVPLSAFDEAIVLFASIPAMALLVASAIVVRTRNQWAALGIVVLWVILASIVSFGDTDIQQEAMIEGCMGSTTLYLAIVGAICIALVAYTAPRKASS